MNFWMPVKFCRENWVVPYSQDAGREDDPPVAACRRRVHSHLVCHIGGRTLSESSGRWQ